MTKYIVIKKYDDDSGEGVNKFNSKKQLHSFLENEEQDPDMYEIYEVTKELEFTRITIKIKEK